ncbi:hypothetical protein Q8A67_020541 [Cirrhinus molitorella]|uniref:Uncharacterized protein n=1 Tax=Cirrhinus molitorella TaxID=172907 RepID=A0AA88PJR3_9TELE|nr:hypothetical protein Q8A67_020541 [Cirrhinus molitorella]
MSPGRGSDPVAVDYAKCWLLSRSLGLSTWRGQGALGKGSMTTLSEQFPVFFNICSPLGLHHSASSAAVNPSTPASPMCPDPAPDPLPACPTPFCAPVHLYSPPEINSSDQSQLLQGSSEDQALRSSESCDCLLQERHVEVLSKSVVAIDHHGGGDGVGRQAQ